MPGTAGFGVTNAGLQGISILLGERCTHKQLRLIWVIHEGNSGCCQGIEENHLTPFEDGKIRAAFWRK
jgi:hypothetical protein